MDEIDIHLLELLQEDSSSSNVELAEAVGLSPAGIHKRVRRLQADGYIDRYTALLNRERLGYDLLCFVHITLVSHQPDSFASVRARAHSIPEILECYEITGETDVLLKVAVQNRQHLQRFLRHFSTNLPQVDKVRTTIVLEEMKATTRLPVTPSKETTMDGNQPPDSTLAAMRKNTVGSNNAFEHEVEGQEESGNELGQFAGQDGQ